jgi:MFS family permease
VVPGEKRAVQGRPQLGDLPPHPGPRHLCEAFGAAFSGDDGAQHVPAGDAVDIADGVSSRDLARPGGMRWRDLGDDGREAPVLRIRRPAGRQASGQPGITLSPHYKWIALVNTTLGVLMVTIDGSIVLIALPDVFRGIKLNPLTPGNSFYLLWMILGFLVVTSVLVVTFGRIGDMYGRVRIYNLGFAIFTVFSLVLSVTWMTGTAAAIFLIVGRVFQGVGGAMLFANSAAILTDVFPPGQRGMALGINGVAATSGTFIGLVAGGLLAPINWRLIFLVSVPIGLFCTVWAYTMLHDVVPPRKTSIDWAGNLTFAVGLIAVMVGITFGIEPYGTHNMGWTSPVVIGALGLGVALLIAFGLIEQRVAEPMFRLQLFRIRAFTAGTLASFLSAVGRGGLMFMLIIWLQGIWLPLHGYDFARTPLWAGIYMLPLTAGFIIAGPISGILSDRYGARPFATAGMLLTTLSFVLLELLPVDFGYWEFAPLLLMMGLSNGLFMSPNRAAVMSSLPAEHRGAGSGMTSTFQNSAQVFSIGIFFTLMIVGLSAVLPASMYAGLVHQGVSHQVATRVAHLPPVSTLFAAFLGYNPMQHLLGASVLAHLPAGRAAIIQGRSFFPNLISSPFEHGLHTAFDFAIGACLAAAAASWFRGERHADDQATNTAKGLSATDPSAPLERPVS